MNGRKLTLVGNPLGCSVSNAPLRSDCGAADGLRLCRVKAKSSTCDEGGEAGHCASPNLPLL
ncbi:MAG TPA: hypothetical protein DDX19_20755 [Rhodopirellula baltica]|nr:hypothetical protein [Rhodopirellula baltica]